MKGWGRGGGERTERDAEIAEGAAGDRQVDGELGVAEGGEKGAEAGNGVGKNDGGAGVEAGGAAGGDENAGADHAADAEPDEVVPAQRSPHVGAGPGFDPAHFLEGRGHRAGSSGQAGRGLSQGSKVCARAREGRAVALH